MEPGRWQQICDLYSEALDLTPSDRATLLGQRCRGDAELRTEVESLLAMRSKRGVLDSEIRAANRIRPSREALPPGTRLGPHEIVAPLGAGGMGTVYRARDPRVNRDVAIKVSAEEFSERFKREARVVASLNHPNICQLYDVGSDYLVMELVAGESPRGPLSLEEVIRISQLIAEALDYAHEKGVIHRDLKPANIKITPEGALKVLDFGLAKLIERPGGADIENSPTVTMSATGAGVILGTAPYMAPEQASGKVVDRRADIWSFGAVFYELYTGHRPFRGDSVVDILALILKHEPDWDALPVGTPTHIRELLRWCLEKDRRQRLQSIGDARILLGRTPPAPQRSRPWIAWWAAALLTLVAISGWLRSVNRINEPPPMILTIVPPPGTELGSVGTQASAPEISPDGSAVLYNGRGGLYVRRLDALESRLVAGSARMSGGGFWSPDSTTVVFPAGTRLMKVRIPDGAPETVMPLHGLTREGSWSENGTILMSAFPLRAVPASGGEGVPVEIPGLPGEYKNPEFLPGGNDFLFLRIPQYDRENAEVCLGTMEGQTGARVARLFKNATAARYTPAGGGRILFVRDDNLYSQRLNRRDRKLEGEPELVVRGVASQPGADVGRADFSVSRNGVVAWRPGKAALTQITTFDRKGNVIAKSGPPGPINWMVLSPDETHVIANGDLDMLFDVGQPGRQTLPTHLGWFGWSRDGTRVVGVKDERVLVEFPANGVGEVRELGPVDLKGISRDLSPDGKWVVSMIMGGGGILVARLDGSPEDRGSTFLVRSDNFTGSPRFSPDGRWFVYQSTGLVAQPFPGPGPRQFISSRGAFPQWRGDGKEIVYLDGQDIMSVAVDMVGGRARFSPPQVLISGLRLPPGLNGGSRPLAISRDGSRIYFPQALEQPETSVIHLKTGWLN
jgi:serine/threonine protein kinase